MNFLCWLPVVIRLHLNSNVPAVPCDCTKQKDGTCTKSDYILGNWSNNEALSQIWVEDWLCYKYVQLTVQPYPPGPCNQVVFCMIKSLDDVAEQHNGMHIGVCDHNIPPDRDLTVKECKPHQGKCKVEKGKSADYVNTMKESQTTCPCNNFIFLKEFLERKCWDASERHSKVSVFEANRCMGVYNNVRNKRNIYQSSQKLQEILEETLITETTPISAENLTALLLKPTDGFGSLKIFANSTQVMSGKDFSSRTVEVHLPAELNAGPSDTVVFCMIKKVIWNETDELYDGTLYGLSVRNKTIEGLSDRVNITITMMTNISEEHRAECKFLKKTEEISSSGCETIQNDTHITCSCDHLTYFAVLLIPVDTTAGDQQVLSIITTTGCSISLISLLVSVLLFLTHRKLREDDSKKIHMSLAVALIILNMHFLSSQAASSSGLCIYMGVALHYSLLASFMWMALEGFHLYLLLVRVFNIYIRRYLLKLSVVGWGVPAVIISFTMIADNDAYGREFLDSTNETAICYIKDYTVKMVTTLGVFCMVYLFNLTIFGMMIKWSVEAQHNKPKKVDQCGQSMHDTAKKEVVILLSLMLLLGITWGLVFFSFGPLHTPFLYVFCILNSLQGFFIFIIFLLSWKKTKKSPLESVTDTSSTKS